MNIALEEYVAEKWQALARDEGHKSKFPDSPPPYRISQKDVERAARLRREGLTLEQVGAELGCSRTAVMRLLRESS